MDGAPQRVDQTTRQGEIILLDFWHLACAPCLRAMPKLEELYKRYRSAGFVVYGLNTFDNPTQKQETLQKFKAKMDISYPLLFSDKEMASKYLVKSFPTIYLVKEGKIIYAKVGYTEESMKELERVIVENINN
ncbi:MAG: TlpA family protein disulfide reductase [Saprospiraceae bacterium]|nr:TlpA family protein disulfide reductase [Saprospiraceae bacterium]